MNRFLLLLTLFVVMLPGATGVLAFQPSTSVQSSDPQTEMVCITRTGKKYHRDGCRYLSRSRIPTTLKTAKSQGYTACKVCQPPQ